MAFSEDLSAFLTDFGVSCTSGATTALGILDMPGQLIADSMVISTDYQLTCKASDFGNLKYNDSISVDGVAYTVRETRLIDDGRFCEVSLMKT
jgi:riboflavin synthase alpha subunit